MIKRTTIIQIITVLNIILFLYSGISKMMEYSVFKEQLAVSPILGFIAKPVALLLPWVEFVVVMLLVIPRWRLKGLYACFSLMILFTAYIIALFSISKEMPCTCGGILDLLSWQQHNVFNTAFIGLNLWAIILLKREKKELSKEWNEESDFKVSRG